MSRYVQIIRQEIVWLVPGLVALAVGLAGIGVPELWRDEVSSWSAAGRPLRGLFGILANVDASNGASYVLLHAWAGLFGDSPAALRLPSALAVAGAASFTALIARRMFASPVAGLAGGLLLATVPQISRYAQEARAYAVVACAVAAATWLLLRALERPAVDRWAWYALATGVAGVFHLVSLACLVGQLPMVAAAARRPDARRVLRQWPLAVAAGVAPALPVIALGRMQSGRQLSWLAAPTVRDLRFVWQELFGSHQVLYAFLVLALPALLLRATRRSAVLLLLAAALPVGAVWAVSRLGSTSFFLPRYLLFTVPLWAALAGGGVGALVALLRRAVPALRAPADRDARRAPAALSAAAAVLLVAAAAAVPAWLGLDHQRSLRTAASHTDTDYRGAARLVAAGYAPGDGLVAVGGDMSWMMVGPAVSYYLPAGVHPRQFFVRESATAAHDLFAVECPVPAACVGDERRVWVVTIGTGDDPYEWLPAEQARALRAAFVPAEVRHVPGLTVSLLVRRPAVGAAPAPGHA
ncbi:glycosyltransferase family 39 protein [Kitasatospora sp. DSM 101779]|uniref:glycosyltransferase family 39 protein n=1 Tax=Kitasatospora sp. DSM 101779 TaxID=2853165 RepID=UPI0021DA02AC|nr:glycosyltransferase family 39 protein [Kitasatospora sp. DSM 101779]MCU7823236.1 glycosyltransferase family 39 protein [Kitasatospora sp. DSM 101779]